MCMKFQRAFHVISSAFAGTHTHTHTIQFSSVQWNIVLVAAATAATAATAVTEVCQIFSSAKCFHLDILVLFGRLAANIHPLYLQLKIRSSTFKQWHSAYKAAIEYDVAFARSRYRSLHRINNKTVYTDCCCVRIVCACVCWREYTPRITTSNGSI